MPADRLSELISASSYGTVLVLGALCTITVTEVSVGYGLELVAGVGAATWIAHLFAELLAAHASKTRVLDRDEMWTAGVDGSPILASTVLPAGILMLGRIDLLPDGAARALAMVVGLGQLLAIGVLAGQLAPARRSTVWIFGAMTFAVGLGVVVVTAWLH